MFKGLAAGFIHLLGGSTAEEVEYIERQWQGKLARGQNPPCTPGGGGSGGTGHTPAMRWPSDGPLFIPAATPPLQTADNHADRARGQAHGLVTQGG